MEGVNFISPEDMQYLFEIKLSDGKKLQIQSHFQQYEDVKVGLRQMLSWEGIDEIYTHELDEQILSQIHSKKQKILQYKMQQLIENQSEIDLVKQRWASFFDEKQKQNQNIQLIDETNYNDFRKLQNNQAGEEILKNFFQNINDSDSKLYESFKLDQLKQNNLHSQEISQACSQGKKQHEITELVNRNQIFIQQLTRIYNQQFLKKQLQFQEEFSQILKSKVDNTFQEKKTHQIKQEKNSENCYLLHLCYGSQKKYKFKLKILQSSSFFDLYQNYKTHNSLEKQALFIPQIKQQKVDTLLLNHLQFQTDVIFKPYMDQVKQTNMFLTKNAIYQTPNQFWHFQYENPFKMIQDHQFRDLFDKLNFERIKKFIINIELFIRCKENQTQNDQYKFSLKDFCETTKSLLHIVKQELQFLASQYPINQHLRTIQFVIPIYPENNLLDKVKEIIKTVFD